MIDWNASRVNVRRLIDANIIGILVGNFDGRVRDANQEFLRIIGYEPSDIASGALSRAELTPPEWHHLDTKALAQLAASGTVQPFEKEYFHKDGSRVPVLIGGATLDDRGGIILFILDLSDRKRIETHARDAERREAAIQLELAHANRISTMGQLTASIAHDVSQPLSGILINAQLGLRLLSADEPDLKQVRMTLGRIVRDGTRGAEIIDRIRTLSMKTSMHITHVDTNAVIREILDLTRSVAQKNGVRVRAHLVDEIPPVAGDRVQLQQVILNLIVNAIEAMTAAGSPSRELLLSSSGEKTGSVLVTVSDSGPGVPPPDLKRVFEPFYTTKPDGLGLGLSICRTIVEAHGGVLWAEPNEAAGTVFSVQLPVAESHGP